MKEIRSRYEKMQIMLVLKEEERLPYPTKVVHSDIYRDEEVYIMPDENKKTLLTILWPFVEAPEMDELLYDIHEDSYTYFKDCQIIRWNDRNIIVSEFYFHSGGTCLDLVKYPEWKDSEIVVQTLK